MFSLPPYTVWCCLGITFGGEFLFLCCPLAISLAGVKDYFRCHLWSTLSSGLFIGSYRALVVLSRVPMFSLKYCLPFVQKPNSRCSHSALNTQWVIHCKLHSVLAGSLFKSVCFEKVCLITMTAQLKWEGSLPNHPLHSFIPPAVHLEKHLVE